MLWRNDLGQALEFIVVALLTYSIGDWLIPLVQGPLRRRIAALLLQTIKKTNYYFLYLGLKNVYLISSFQHFSHFSVFQLIRLQIGKNLSIAKFSRKNYHFDISNKSDKKRGMNCMGESFWRTELSGMCPESMQRWKCLLKTRVMQITCEENWTAFPFCDDDLGRWRKCWHWKSYRSSLQARFFFFSSFLF